MPPPNSPDRPDFDADQDSAADPAVGPASPPEDNGSVTKSRRSLAGIAGIVAIATLISKVFGLVRQQAIAAAFGVGVAVDAYSYAYVIPGFLLVLLGGINGPFHSAIVSVISKRKPGEIAPLIETITTVVGLALLVVTIGIWLFSGSLIDLVAPGLSQTPEGLATRAIALQQLQIMAPMAVLAGLIGIGFGSLNAADQYWLPSISPLFSSVSVLVGIAGLMLATDIDLTSPEFARVGGLVLAWGTLAGAVLQWLVQVPAQWRSGLGRLRLRFQVGLPGVRDVFKILGPATFSSGMMQINVYTDLFFASYIPGAAAALGYANLLVQTPLGIISNIILVPLLPVFSRLADPRDWGELKARIRQGLMLTALTMLPLSAIIVVLAFPMVRVVYERFAFDREASQAVTAVLMAYGVGMFVYLGRDVLVRVFYALGDGDTPFRVSVVNIFLNALLDFLLIKPFGAPGLVFATVGVNLVSMVVFLVLLDRRLHLPWRSWGRPFGTLIGCSVIAGGVCWGALRGMEALLGTEGFGVQLMELILPGGLAVVTFGGCAWALGIPEMTLLLNRIRQRLGSR